MPSWGEWLVRARQSKDPFFLDKNLQGQLAAIGELRRGSDVLFYASGFLQHPGERHTIITKEDINGFLEAMGSLSGKKLVLILHTPGGVVDAVDNIVGCLHGRYDEITTIVPCMAMSGGSMISLASDCIVMGKQSQIGPIDIQLPVGGLQFAAWDILGVQELLKPETQYLCKAFFQSKYPPLISQSERGLEHGKNLLSTWLQKRTLLKEKGDAKKKKARDIAKFFNADPKDGKIYAHGQRISIETLLERGIEVKELESDPKLQEAVMNAYHLMTLIFELTHSVKFVMNQRGTMWAKGRPPDQPK